VAAGRDAGVAGMRVNYPGNPIRFAGGMMTKDQELQLVRQFPSFFRHYAGDPKHTCMAWGCAHGDGWFGLLKKLCEEIDRSLDCEDFYFTQIKEKFGELSIGCEGGNPRVAKLIEEAQKKSTTVCELCGAPGENDFIRPGWLQTLCGRCRNSSPDEEASHSKTNG
jgi:hypothetical protein